ncbi:hypothetical protein [Vibrio harveyi]|uniref:hypothetical protein n=1 Tax=Vibrio harveyi TaxID=669 RepID=UPI002480F9A2|nr:hypothetical protein [Vibrio harveyi]
MKFKECTWQHGDVEFRLRTENNQERYMVYLSVDSDVSIAETNPISIHIRLDAITALNEKFYVMMIGGITVRNIPEEAAKEISKTLECELTERCDKCHEEGALTFDVTGEHEHICFACTQAMVS